MTEGDCRACGQHDIEERTYCKGCDEMEELCSCEGDAIDKAYDMIKDQKLTETIQHV